MVGERHQSKQRKQEGGGAGIQPRWSFGMHFTYILTIQRKHFTTYQDSSHSLEQIPGHIGLPKLPSVCPFHATRHSANFTFSTTKRNFRPSIIAVIQNSASCVPLRFIPTFSFQNRYIYSITVLQRPLLSFNKKPSTKTNMSESLHHFNLTPTPTSFIFSPQNSTFIQQRLAPTPIFNFSQTYFD